VKFLVDMALSPDLTHWLRTGGHDAVHASDIEMHRATDTEIMARAKAEGRTVVTADLDFPQLLAMSRAIEPSVILFRDGNWSDREVIARMGEVLTALPADDIAQSIVVVERDRIRRRRLPLG
jgi:predicted nuclease of predicted toxin-antitoxin system